MRHQVEVTIGALVVAIPTTVPWCTCGRYTDHGLLVHSWSLYRPRSSPHVSPISTVLYARTPHPAHKHLEQPHHLAHAQSPSNRGTHLSGVSSARPLLCRRFRPLCLGLHVRVADFSFLDACRSRAGLEERNEMGHRSVLRAARELQQCLELR